MRPGPWCAPVEVFDSASAGRCLRASEAAESREDAWALLQRAQVRAAVATAAALEQMRVPFNKEHAMEITDVRLTPNEQWQPGNGLLSGASVVLNGCLLLREMKLIQGSKGAFLSMPSRKRHGHCSKCGRRADLDALFCSNCGEALTGFPAGLGGRSLYLDVFHPIIPSFRAQLTRAVIAAYEQELRSLASLHPGAPESNGHAT